MWIIRSANLLFESCSPIECMRYLSNKCAVFTKTQRKLYLRCYPTVVVNPDGSTFTIRHYEPRKIIKLPIDLSTVSEEEKAKILQGRRPVKKVRVVEEVHDNFDSSKYLKMLKRRAN